ncbi:bifunctional UDP-N-acetylmuramoyl-tripeptide:D-alanyl-D-alanine ligase/alanine racemase [Cytophaga hutchinsonii]|uniref:bifunctional UDP-N-acetylmuramoyl-tripeptide:D-alanyl-D-alanine ligase/alanine racemase n=1 Tax=Cytophaga hutchinsonii TaxID=985 RepID=UPI001EE42DCF|nr:bifunctional UDP-N-acetylmuramoyl-tripeptide:D-alanyl-D-alanine ligase/alanine racemase [Cytophaga hutchinsonii]
MEYWLYSVLLQELYYWSITSNSQNLLNPYLHTMKSIDISVNELPGIVQGECIQQSTEPNTFIKQLVIDSRKLMAPAGAVFFAIDGKHHDGHAHITEMYKKGVRIFIVEKSISLNEIPQAACIRVKSSVSALQACAAYRRKQLDIPIVAITGSNAKTIVKEWLSQTVAADYSVVKSPRSYNSQIGVPLSVWALNERHTIGIFEAGISTTKEMQALQKVIEPTIGIFTNIGSAHDKGFKNREEKIQEKLKLFADCKVVIYCSDHEEIHAEITAQHLPTFNWSLQSSATIEYSIAAKDSFQTQIEVKTKEHQGFFYLPFVDDASIENALHVATTLFYLGYSIQEVSRKISGLQAVGMRLELKEANNDCYLIDDSYNNDLAGLSIALDFLEHVKQSEVKTVILSDVLESGLDSAVLYKEVASYLTTAQVQRVIAIGSQITELKKWYNGRAEYYPTTEAFIKDLTKTVFEKEIVLVKGARIFQFEKIVSRLQHKVHETVLEINLDALIHNLNVYRSKLKPDTKIMCMVKAFSYGSGGFEIAQLLQYHGVDYLAVAYADEGARLRENGITLPIMVMNPTLSSFDTILRYELEPEIYEPVLLKQIIEYAQAKQKHIGIHIKIDTGMKRLGFEKKDVTEIAQQLKHTEFVKVYSVFTHLAASDSAEHDAFTAHQLNLFDEVISLFQTTLNYSFIKHAANSSGIMRFKEAHYDMVRLGIGLYGVESAGLYQNELQAISVFKTHISQIKEITTEESVGYSRKGRVTKPSKIATIAVGYADGYNRRFGNGIGEVLVNGVRCPIIGNVCMDMSMVDVTDAHAAQGDEVILFGHNPTVSDLAKRIGTIPYEILTSVGARVKRIFYSE